MGKEGNKSKGASEGGAERDRKEKLLSTEIYQGI